MPFVRRARDAPGRPDHAVAALGALARTNGRRRILRLEAATGGDIVASLAADTPLRLDGAASGWLRVRTPDGRRGWVPRRDVEPLVPLRRVVFPESVAIRDRADAGAPALAFTSRERIPVLGTFEDFVLVETSDGRRGWVVENGASR
jgi:SH3-like domain-containing protein